MIKIIVKAVITAIRLYQKTLSPDHGWFKFFKPYGGCRFYPTCSQYTIEALQNHGLVKGTKKSLRRLSRCHPWTAGGLDPVENKIINIGDK